MEGIGRDGSVCLHYYSISNISLTALTVKISPRTSLSALTCQAAHVTVKIPANAMAVLDFQFDGRVHQPPTTSRIQLEHGVIRKKAHAPAGDQTCFGYGYLAPPPCKSLVSYL
jgi:hypothetical protein